MISFGNKAQVLRGGRKRNWHIWLILTIVVGVIVYAAISYFAISNLKSKPKSFNPFASSVTPSPYLLGDQLKQGVKKARERALENPFEKMASPSGNAILKWSKDYQITYEANRDTFTINIYNPKLDETRKAAEDYLIHQLLKTDDQQVLCATKVLIALSRYADPTGKVNWGPFSRLSICDGGQAAIPFFDKLTPQALACTDVWSYAYYCSCEFLYPYFGTQTWAARLIGARESACNPSARGPNGEAGVFQIYPGGSYDPDTNAAQAVNKSGGGWNWSQWAVCGRTNSNSCAGDDVCYPGPDDYGHASSCAPPTFNIVGMVYQDNNVNGVPDGGDWPLGGVWVTLSGLWWGGPTNPGSGDYGFYNVPAGGYAVYINVPPNYTPTTPAWQYVVGGPDAWINFGIRLNDFDTSGTVFVDKNRNGIRDPGDPPYTGVTLITMSGIGFTTTDASGNYIFRQSHWGTYNVTITVPPKYTATTPTTRSVTGPPDVSGIDFGIAPNEISGFVYIDANKNGFKDPGETNYSGATTITSSRGAISYPAATTYFINDLLAGPLTVSYPSMSSDYTLTYPLNGPPPTFGVTVGQACSTGGANGAHCKFGTIDNLNFGITNLYPWYQSTCGDVRIDSGINNRIYQGNYGMITPNVGSYNAGAAPNLAAGKPVNASSTWESGGLEASKAFDGDMSTLWVAHSGDPYFNNQWVSVDLGAGTTYNRVILKEYSYNGRINSYKLQWSNNGIDYYDIPGTNGTTLPSDKVIDFSPVTARYIRLYINSSSSTPTMNEMEVYRVAELPNLALNKPASASTTWSPQVGYDPAKAFDADLSTRWNSEFGIFDNQWLSVDLGTGTTYNTVILKEYTVYANITSYKLQWSNDGIDYHDIPGTGQSSIGDNKVLVFTPVTSRYLRLYVNTTASNTPTINEMEVYNNLTLTPNLALNQIANASSSWELGPGNEPSKAFDGNVNTRWNAQSPASYANNQWLSVNLGVPRTYNRVVIDEASYPRVTSYKLQWSNDGTNYTDIPGTTGTSIGNYKIIDFSPSITSKYMRLSMPTSAPIPTINEIEIYRMPLVTDIACNTPGIAFSGDSPYSFGKGQVSSTNWIVGGSRYPEVHKTSVGSGGIFSSYANIMLRSTQAGVSPTNLSTVCAISDCTLPASLPHGIYVVSGDLYLNAYDLPLNQNYVFLINGDLHIKGDIQSPKGSGASAFFSASGNIVVESNVGSIASSKVSNLDGIFSADKAFIINSAGTCNDLRLNIAGGVITNAGLGGYSLQNNRDLCGSNSSYPTISFSQRLDFLFNMPDFIKLRNSYSWEVAP